MLMNQEWHLFFDKHIYISLYELQMIPNPI
jgi:hypothetical protein